jgi:photosystem II stability/assembly factor-like uncharacterized protein
MRDDPADAQRMAEELARAIRVLADPSMRVIHRYGMKGRGMANPKVMFVAMRDGILRSENAGETWTRLSSGPKNGAAVAIDPKRPNTIYAATAEGRIHQSEDGGGRWDEQR